MKKNMSNWIVNQSSLASGNSSFIEGSHPEAFLSNRKCNPVLNVPTGISKWLQEYVFDSQLVSRVFTNPGSNIRPINLVLGLSNKFLFLCNYTGRGTELAE